jgi:hypothetical protein
MDKKIDERKIKHSESTSSVSDESFKSGSDIESVVTILSSPPKPFPFSSNEDEKIKNKEYFLSLNKIIDSKISDQFYSLLYDLRVQPEK